jgi:hypothetical protein
MSAKEAVDNGEIHLSQLPNLIKAKAAYLMLVAPTDKQDTRGVWYWGAPGLGKSHKVRKSEPELYLKAQNKWWDGYSGEKAVLLDDFDKGGICLGHYLKIWTDKWACNGEIKGSTIPLNHDRFYITSNYSPDTLFNEDEELLTAIKRRFKITHFDSL